METTAVPAKTGGLKEKASDEILGSLRRQVDKLPAKPDLASLKEKQQGFLLDDDHIRRFILGHQQSDPTNPIQLALVNYLRFKIGGKPKQATIEKLQDIQRRCLLTDKQLKVWVIDWWAKRHP